MRSTIDFSGLHYFDANWIRSTRETITADLCVYGASAGGVVAAVKAARQGRRVVLLQPGRHLGGLTSGGLGWTDYGKKHVIGGMARRFYHDLGQAYGKDEEWQFEPHVAESLLNAMIAGTTVEVRLCQYLDRVEMERNRISAITLLGGLRVTAGIFIDASYEGDLMAKAGVTYTVGREGNARYGETLNGIQVHPTHQFSHAVDPYVKAGDPTSGLLPGIVGEDLSQRSGEGDHRVQAYCFRMCMTDDPGLKIEWPRPDGFDARLYELATRWFNSEKDIYNDQLIDYAGRPCDVPKKFDIFPNRTPAGHCKTDTNNHGAVSSDFIGESYPWSEGSYEERERIFLRHFNYQLGYYWHVANAPEIPERYRRAYARWGLPRDEFKDTGHWPHQLYIREARRMVSDVVLTEHDCRLTRRASDPVGMGSYNLDSHNCSRFVKVEGGRARVLNEGDVQVPPAGPYGISYRSIVPRQGECENLFVPVCLSASHIAYGSARMEPVFMALGESAAVAAGMALDASCPVQEVDYRALRERLLADGQILQVQTPEHTMT